MGATKSVYVSPTVRGVDVIFVPGRGVGAVPKVLHFFRQVPLNADDARYASADGLLFRGEGGDGDDGSDEQDAGERKPEDNFLEREMTAFFLTYVVSISASPMSSVRSTPK